MSVNFETARDERIEKGTVEKKAKSLLETRMNEKGITHYRDSENGIEAFFEVERNLKVKRIKGSEKAGEGDTT